MEDMTFDKHKDTAYTCEFPIQDNSGSSGGRQSWYGHMESLLGNPIQEEESVLSDSRSEN